MRLLATVILVSAAAALSAAASAGAAPANDNFAAAVPISGAAGNHLGSTSLASKEPGEPNHAGNPGGRSVWFVWTAPETARFAFSTRGSVFDTVLAVYTGTQVDALTEVASNDDTGDFSVTSRVAFSATEGTTYAIAVDGFGGKQGRLRLEWRLGQPNDLFASPEIISGEAGSVDRSNEGASVEPSEPDPWGSLSSVWFEWTAPESTLVKFSVVGGLDSVIAVYTGSAIESLTRIAANDDDPFWGCCGSFVGFEAVAGTVYRVAVGGFGSDEGRFALSWSRLSLGTAGADTIVGTSGIDEIRGFGGNDVLRGLGGNDILLPGPGNDTVFGGGGADSVVDWGGADFLGGGPGADTLRALDGRGNDTLSGGPNRDICSGDRSDIKRGCP